MKRAYYYTAASMPHLDFSSPSVLSSDRFLNFCKVELHPGDFAILKTASLLPDSEMSPSLAVLVEWHDWERSLRNELARLRARRLGWDAERYQRRGVRAAALEDLARDILSIDSPAAAEEKLDRARWGYLQGLEAGRYFDLERLVIYYLKLQLVEKRSVFDEAKGLEKREHVLALLGCRQG